MLEKKLSEANKKVIALTEQLDRMSQRGGPRSMKDDVMQNRSELPQLGSNYSENGVNQVDMIEEADMSSLSNIIQNNPKKAKEMMLKYKQEINYLRSKLVTYQGSH